MYTRTREDISSKDLSEIRFVEEVTSMIRLLDLQSKAESIEQAFGPLDDLNEVLRENNMFCEVKFIPKSDKLVECIIVLHYETNTLNQTMIGRCIKLVDDYFDNPLDTERMLCLPA
jgi:hypothetical protein